MVFMYSAVMVIYLNDTAAILFLCHDRCVE